MVVNPTREESEQGVCTHSSLLPFGPQNVIGETGFPPSYPASTEQGGWIHSSLSPFQPENGTGETGFRPSYSASHPTLNILSH